MPLVQKIDQDLRAAMTERDALTVSVLRMVKSALHNQQIALKKKELSEAEVLSVLQNQAKRRRESIEAFTKGERKELALKERHELEIIERYLPVQLSPEEIKKVVQSVISASAEKNFGLVMRAAMAKLKGQADGALVSKTVKELLAE